MSAVTKLEGRLEPAPEDEVDEPENRPSKTSAGTLGLPNSPREEVLEATETCDTGRSTRGASRSICLSSSADSFRSRSEAEKRIGLPLKLNPSPSLVDDIHDSLWNRACEDGEALIEPAISSRLMGMLLDELSVMTRSAVWGLRIDLPRALEMDELGVLLFESVSMVRTSSCSSSSMASLRPSLPLHVLKRVLAAEGRREEAIDEGGRGTATLSWWPSSETGTSSERPMYCTSSETSLARCGRLSLGWEGSAMVGSVGVLVTSCSGWAKSGVTGVSGERTDELDEAHERVDSFDERTAADLFFRGEVEPKMALPGKLLLTIWSKACWSCDVWPLVDETEISDSAAEHQLSRE